MKAKKKDPKKFMVRVISLILCALLALGSVASILVMIFGGYYY